MININPIKKHIVAKLKEGLSKKLAYHSIHHTLDVTQQCLTIANEEGITDLHELECLEIAALYHDIGFIYTYDRHEAKGCEIVREQLPGFGVTDIGIEVICGLIMATKVPQQPKNHLQQIICDADLDYLGRPDFYQISNDLRIELIAYNLITDQHDWEERQLNFLNTHQYFTKTSLEKREPVKREFIRQLINRKESTKK